MNKCKNFAVLAFVSLFLIGCSTAQRASDVNAVRIPVAPYLKMNCKELSTEQSLLLKEAQSMTSQVDASYKSDKTAELVTWILFAPAAFMIDGNQEEAAKLAGVKGQLEAIQEAMKINECTLQLLPEKFVLVDIKEGLTRTKASK